MGMYTEGTAIAFRLARYDKNAASGRVRRLAGNGRRAMAGATCTGGKGCSTRSRTSA